MVWSPIDAIARDVRFGVRMLRKQPGFTLAVTFSLALGVGASTALFTLVRNVLLRSLAVPDPARLVLVYNSYPKAGIPHVGAAGADYVDRLREAPSFEEQSLFTAINPSLEIDGAPERVHAMEATASFFRLIRVAPRAGRAFRADEERAGSNRVVVLSAGLAERMFGSSDAAAGRSIRLNGEPHQVVGVMPRGFVFIDAAVQLWLPLTLTDRDKEHTHANNWTYIGRLKVDRTISQAQAEIDAINAANLERFPETRQLVIDAGFRSIAVPLQDDLVRDIRPTLQYLWGGALFVLLIGVLNVASLVQARAHARTRELATRLALGAGLPRLARQLIVEHLVLALAAAGAGLLLAFSGLRAVDTLHLGHLPTAAARHIDVAVLGYVMATAVLLSAILGAVPALTLLHGSRAAMLRLESRNATAAGGGLVRRLLVVLQVSVAFVLLIAAGLMLASFRRAAGVDLGFTTDRILTASVTLPAARYRDVSAVRAFADQALASIRTRAGVISAGVTSSIPLGDDYGMQMILAEGYRPEPGQSFVGSYRNAVSSDFFETIGATLVGGRFFDRRDGADAPRTVIVDSRLARRFWPGGNPVGRRMYFPERRNPFTMTDRTPALVVVGVVKDLRMRGAADAAATIGAYFVPFAQDPARSLTFAIRTTFSPSSLFDVRAAIRERDPALPIYDVRSMDEREQIALAPRRLPAAVASAFAAVALGLSTVGIYGVLAFALAQRRKEIAIRIALGSSPHEVFGLIVREGAALIAIGLAIGLAGAWLAGRSAESYLFGVRAHDPAVFSMALAVLGGAAAIACVLPAHRATRINPVAALGE